MRSPSIRTSLTMWFIASTSLLLAAFSLTLYFGIRSSLVDGVDAELLARADGLVALCEWDDDEDDVEFDAAEGTAGALLAHGPVRSTEVWLWSDRKVLHHSGTDADTRGEPDAASIAAEGLVGGSAFETVESGGNSLRRCTRLAHFAPRETASSAMVEAKRPPPFSILVRVTGDLADVERQLARIRMIILVLAVLAFAAMFAFASLISRRLIRPLAMLGEAASGMRAGTPGSMPHRGTDDEVDRLARVLDGSFEALQSALVRQTRFTADAAHELRNPITMIKSSAEVARRRERSPDEYDAFLEDIEVTATRMGDVVESLLMLARMDAGAARATFRPIELGRVAEEVVCKLTPAERARVASDLAAPAPTRGDPGLVKVLIENLLTNALRYSDDSSRIELSSRRENGASIVEVRDHGAGIPDEKLPHIFDRFYRVDDANPNKDGAGLGLSIVAAVARLHDATLECDAAFPGTRFTIRFPAAATTPRPDETRRHAQPETMTT